MYVNVDGSRKSSATSTDAAITMRLTFWRPPMSGSKRIAPIRSDIVLAIDDLLVAVRAHLLSAREAYQLVFGAAAMDRTRQLGRTLDALAILRLAEPDARWREVDDHPIKKGATRRDQRDEEHPFHYDGTHEFALPWRDSARRRCTSTTKVRRGEFRPPNHSRERSAALRSAEEELHHPDGVGPREHVRMVTHLQPRIAFRRDQISTAHDHRHGGAVREGELLEAHPRHGQRLVDVVREQLPVEAIERLHGEHRRGGRGLLRLEPEPARDPRHGHAR